MNHIRLFFQPSPSHIILILSALNHVSNPTSLLHLRSLGVRSANSDEKWCCTMYSTAHKQCIAYIVNIALLHLLCSYDPHITLCTTTIISLLFPFYANVKQWRYTCVDISMNFHILGIKFALLPFHLFDLMCNLTVLVFSLVFLDVTTTEFAVFRLGVADHFHDDSIVDHFFLFIFHRRNTF